MAEKVLINGVPTNRAGVYGQIDGTRLATASTATGILGLVADLATIENDVLHEVLSAREAQALDPENTDFLNVINALYEGSADPGIVAGPQKVWLVSPRTTTQPSVTLTDGAGNDQIVVKLAVWGTKGNRGSIKVAANATDATLRDVTLYYPGRSAATLEGLGSGNVLGVYYAGTDSDVVTMAYNNAALVIAQTISALAPGTFLPTEMVFNDQVSATPSAAASGTNHTLVVNGLDSLGDPVAETLTWTPGDGTATKTTTATLSSVTSLVWTPQGGVATLEVTANAFDLAVEDYPFAANFVDAINAHAARGFHAASYSAKSAKIPSDELDTAAAATISSTSAAEKYIRADNWAVRQALPNLALVESVTDVSSAGAVDQIAALGVTNFTGGTVAASLTAADWTAAIAKLETKTEIAHVLAISGGDNDVNQAAAAHCAAMAAIGERSAWLGGVAGANRATTKAASLLLNTHHAAFAYQEIQRRDARGALTWQSPEVFAAIACGMRLGMTVGDALTWKRPRITDYRSATDLSSEENTAVQDRLDAGLLFVTQGEFGPRWEQGVTTHQTDDNPAYVQESTKNSLDVSTRDIRNQLMIAVGRPGFSGAAVTLQRITTNRLDYQKAVLRWIKDYDPSSVEVVDNGTVYSVGYTVSGVEPITFILVKPVVDRL